MQRVIIEMGMGNDLHGQDYTKAAARAVEDAIRHSSIPLFPALGLDHSAMEVRVTVGVQNPAAVDLDRIVQGLPRGKVQVTATEGGLDITNPDNDEITVVATAAVEAFLDPKTVRALASKPQD
ncbi:MAG: Lin0512 family protein [Paracoccaceae bacterium]|nr:Lin0512 family protein [Paracoccaceae bacterium]